MKVLSRSDLFSLYDEILARGLSAVQLEEYKRSGSFGPRVIVQSSSGSSGGEILRIPRTPGDIADVFARTLVPYLSVFPRPPARIAMLGGISHTEAALKMDLGGIGFCSFRLDQLAELEAYDPEVISCYPHIGRELYRNSALKFPSLKAFKLGGEPVLEADLSLLRARFGGIAVFEQMGSTEMPAVAIGLREEGKARRLPLQRKRFDYAPGAGDAWRPLIVRDNFPGLLFPIREFYDMGDEARYDEQFLYDLRRRGDEEFAYLPLLEELVRAGATNAQLYLSEKRVVVAGSVGMNSISFQGIEFKIEKGSLQKSVHASKLRFLR